jgi:hypothetical protein
VHRENWDDTFTNQDRILKVLNDNIKNTPIFLAGGTGLHRHILRIPYRHSEDLDFFFPTLLTNQELTNITDIIKSIITTNLDVTLVNEKKETQIRRLFYQFNDNDEVIKVEILNFTCDRLNDKSYLKSDIFKTENLYNLLLYKFKALCDRPDTIKDLFDIYFIMREMDSLLISNIIIDINKKFQKAIGIKYEVKHIIQALGYHLKWDIEIGDHIEHLNDLKIEVENFQIELKKAFELEKTLTFSYESRISKKALEFKLTNQDYIDIIEENKFLVDEYNILKND